MSEAEIVYQLSENFNRIWSMLQWWASISLGLIVLAHVASERLNGFLVIVVVTLYSAFSFYVFQLMNRNYESVQGYVSDLQNIVKSGNDLASGTLAYMQPQSSIVVALVIFTLWGTFAGSNAYLIYSYFKGKRTSDA